MHTLHLRIAFNSPWQRWRIDPDAGGNCWVESLDTNYDNKLLVHKLFMIGKQQIDLLSRTFLIALTNIPKSAPPNQGPVFDLVLGCEEDTVSVTITVEKADDGRVKFERVDGDQARLLFIAQGKLPVPKVVNVEVVAGEVVLGAGGPGATVDAGADEVGLETGIAGFDDDDIDNLGQFGNGDF